VKTEGLDVLELLTNFFGLGCEVEVRSIVVVVMGIKSQYIISF
jgi:hypothetical protein